MSYTKQTWVNGETVTAAKLNHLEEGVYKSTILYVPITEDVDESLGEYHYACGVPFNIVESAIQNGQLVVFDITYQYDKSVDMSYPNPIGSLQWEYYPSNHEIHIDGRILFNSSRIIDLSSVVN